MKVIRIWLKGNQWMADFEDDQEIKGLFGTTMIPTAYLSGIPVEEVVERVQALNPDCIVI